jgi:hypothetical protein
MVKKHFVITKVVLQLNQIKNVQNGNIYCHLSGEFFEKNISTIKVVT